jgi:hypothetical protein
MVSLEFESVYFVTSTAYLNGNIIQIDAIIC